MRDLQTKINESGLSDSIVATKFGAGEFNSIAIELENIVTSTAQSLAPASGSGEITNQIARAMFILSNVSQFCVDTGAANAYVVNPVNTASIKATSYNQLDGAMVAFYAVNANTTGCTINYLSLGSKSLTTRTGAALTAGQVSEITFARYNLSSDRWELLFSVGDLRVGEGDITAFELADEAVTLPKLSDSATESSNVRKRVSDALLFVDMTTTTPTVLNSFNIDTVSKIATGKGQVTFTTPLTTEYPIITAGVCQSATSPFGNQDTVSIYSISSTGFSFTTFKSESDEDNFAVVMFDIKAG